MPPVAAHVTRWPTRATIVWMEHRGRRIAPRKTADCWVWSDLYLNHGDILEPGKRPFTSTRARGIGWIYPKGPEMVVAAVYASSGTGALAMVLITVIRRTSRGRQD